MTSGTVALARSATATGRMLSVDTGRCGPCCSHAPMVSTTGQLRDAAAAISGHVMSAR